MNLSIAMATYNGERYLAEQLQSFADQVRRPDQLVVCDDQSTDATLEIVRDFQKRVDFEVIAIRNEVRLGIVRNFSKAIDHCTGDIIFLSDQDDVWAPDKLRKHEEIYLADADGKITLVFNNAVVVDQDLKPAGFMTFDEFGINEKVIEDLESNRAFASLIGTQRVTGCTLSFRAQLWKHLPEASSTMLHDQWLALAASLLGRIQPIREPLNYYRQHSTQAAGVLGAVGDQKPRESLIRQSWLVFQGIQGGIALDLIEKLHEKGVDFPYQDYRQYAIGYLSHHWRRVLAAEEPLAKDAPGGHRVPARELFEVQRESEEHPLPRPSPRNSSRARSIELRHVRPTPLANS